MSRDGCYTVGSRYCCDIIAVTCSEESSFVGVDSCDNAVFDVDVEVCIVGRARADFRAIIARNGDLLAARRNVIVSGARLAADNGFVLTRNAVVITREGVGSIADNEGGFIGYFIDRAVAFNLGLCAVESVIDAADIESVVRVFSGSSTARAVDGDCIFAIVDGVGESALTDFSARERLSAVFRDDAVDDGVSDIISVGPLKREMIGSRISAGNIILLRQKNGIAAVNRRGNSSSKSADAVFTKSAIDNSAHDRISSSVAFDAKRIEGLVLYLVDVNMTSGICTGHIDYNIAAFYGSSGIVGTADINDRTGTRADGSVSEPLNIKIHTRLLLDRVKCA